MVQYFLIMAFVLLLLAMIANPATTTTVTPNSTNAPVTNQSEDVIKAAQIRHNRIFGTYVVILVLTVLGTYLVWSSSNKVQEAIQADALARIEEAKRGVKQLETNNLKLSGDLEIEKEKVAGLQQAAADAKAAQQRVEIDLAKQQERAAKAEKDLAQLRQTMQPRRLTAEQKAALIGMLTGEPKGTVLIMTVLGDGEAIDFANEIDGVLKAAGWTIDSGGPSQGIFSGGGGPVGFGIIVRNAVTAPPYAARIQRAFFSIGVPLAGAENATVPEGTVEILIGRKPNPLSN